MSFRRKIQNFSIIYIIPIIINLKNKVKIKNKKNIETLFFNYLLTIKMKIFLDESKSYYMNKYSKKEKKIPKIQSYNNLQLNFI